MNKQPGKRRQLRIRPISNESTATKTTTKKKKTVKKNSEMTTTKCESAGGISSINTPTLLLCKMANQSIDSERPNACSLNFTPPCESFSARGDSIRRESESYSSSIRRRHGVPAESAAEEEEVAAVVAWDTINNGTGETEAEHAGDDYDDGGGGGE